MGDALQFPCIPKVGALFTIHRFGTARNADGEVPKHSIRSRPMRFAVYIALSAAVIRLSLVDKLSLKAASPIDSVVPGSVLPRKILSLLLIFTQMSVIR